MVESSDASTRTSRLHAAARGRLHSYFSDHPELVTEGDTLEQAYANVSDALAAVIELYEEQGRALPAGIALPLAGQIVWSEALVEVA